MSGPTADATALAARDALRESLRRAPHDSARHLGEALVERGVLTEAQLAAALKRQAAAPTHRSLGSQLVADGLVSESTIERVMADWLGIVQVALESFDPDPEALRLLPGDLAVRLRALPLMVVDGRLVVAVANPLEDHGLLQQLRFHTGLAVVEVAAAPGSLDPAIARAYGGARASAPRSLRQIADDLAHSEAAESAADPAAAAESDSLLVQFVHRMIGEALERRASDIHIETADAPDPVRVRLRIDGDLVDAIELRAGFGMAVVSRLKIMADLDIAEHRKPQDGKIDFARFGGPRVELRMVTVPTVHGLEDVVLRLLPGLKPLPLDAIDLTPAHLEGLRGMIARPYGLILICGPTGSGKTTTLHSVLRELNDGRRKIWTAEDPVEITQRGLRQVQVNPRIGWTFAAAMRTFLRADPDVIMIGEMRDEETARIAVEASLTGHLVMSTLHTNSAAESIARLLEMGLDPFTFSDSLLAVLGQRLVRRLCPACRERSAMDDAELEQLARLHEASGATVGIEPLMATWRRDFGGGDGRVARWRGRGCPSCGGSGFHGRLGLHEVLLAGPAIRETIRRRASAREILDLGRAAGMRTLRQDGIAKALRGLTDVAEVLAATGV